MNSRAALTGLLLALAAGAGLAGEAAPRPEVAEAVKRARADVEKARAKLVARREEASAERVELSRRVSELTAELEEKRESWRLRLLARDNRDTRLAALREKAGFLEEQVAATRAVLVEARRSAEVGLDLADAAQRASKLKDLDRRLESAVENSASIPALTGDLLEFVVRSVEDAESIRRTNGRAVGPDGRELSGTFVHVGGAGLLFSADEPKEARGLVRVEHGSSLPHLWPVSASGPRAALADVAAGREASVLLDVTAGAALRAGEAGRSLWEQIRSGGVVMVPILAIGIVCLLVGLFKFFQLIRVNTDFDGPLAELLEMLRSGRIEAAVTMAGSAPAPLGRLMIEGVTHRAASREDLEEMMHEAIIVETPPLERHLAVLAVGAAVAPLLGLLGTVTGMIRTFGLISVFGSGDPRLLSGGISEALVTTAAGLAVAIPLVLLHAFLSRRVHTITDGLEKGAVGFINSLKTRAPVEDAEA